MADVAESQENAPAERAELTVPEMRQWLRNWVGKAVGKAPDSIDESVPMVELGLSSRDAVAMAADIEDLTGVTLSVAVAFAHPTIESLATRIIEGEPETDLAGDHGQDRVAVAAGVVDPLEHQHAAAFGAGVAVGVG